MPTDNGRKSYSPRPRLVGAPSKFSDSRPNKNCDRPQQQCTDDHRPQTPLASVLGVHVGAMICLLYSYQAWWILQRWNAPVFCTRGYESIGWVTGTWSSAFSSSVRVCCWSAGVAGAEAAQPAANSAGVWYPSELCGRWWLYSFRQAAAKAWAAARFSNTSASSSSSRKPAVEALGVAVLPRAARLDVQRLHARSRQELADRSGDELRAVVAADVLRHAADGEQLDQHVDHVLGRDPPIDLQRQALPRVLIHDRQPLQRATVGRPIEHEVPGPDVVLVLGRTPHTTVARQCPNAAFSAVSAALSAPPAATADRSVCGSPASPRVATTPDESIAVPRMLAHQVQHPGHQALLLVVCSRRVPLRAARDTQGLHARRSDTLKRLCTCTTAARRRAGLSSFPPRLP